jgi:hypothetical protein
LLLKLGKLLKSPDPVHYEALHVYGSYDPNKREDAKLKNWFMTRLDKMPGVSVVLRERQRKRNYPKCPKCQAEVAVCVACSADMRGTEEKGVDAALIGRSRSAAFNAGYGYSPYGTNNVSNGSKL